jgi:sugar lactone lactonase YvrE
VNQQGVIRRTIHVPGDLLLNPEECAVSSSGVIHICDPTATMVRRFKPDGSELAPILSGFGSPTGIEIAKNGKIYIVGNTGEDRQRVTITDSDGNVLDRLAPPDGISFNDARGITSDSENNVYVADFLNARIVKYDAMGRHSLTINDVSAYGINIDGQDNLVVTDFFKRKVVVLSRTGTILSEFTGRETGPGNFFEPSTALVMPDGRLYVSDFVINEVTVWKPARSG